MAWTWCGGARPMPAAAAPATQPSVSERLDRSLRAIEAVQREIPRDTFDPDVILQKAGREPAALFHWVRDRTDWVPYRGSLRGYTGVLMDRMGNGLDRSLLLGELLRRSGHQVRLCRGELPDAQAKALVAKVRPVAVDRFIKAPAGDAFGDDILQRWAAAHQLDLTELRENTRRIAIESARAAEDTVGRVAEQLPAITAALGNATTKPADARAIDTDTARTLADHWWVQYKDGDAWVDLDPLLSDARPGTALTKPVETIAWPDNKPPLDSRFCHEVQVGIVVERWDAGRLHQQTVLTQVLRPSELYGQRITLSHFPMNWPQDLNLLGADKPGELLADAALKQKEWLPMLTVGATQYVQGSFNENGTVNDKPNLDALKGAGKGTAGAGEKAFDVLGVDPPPSPKQSSGVLVAEWIEYEIRVPGQPPQMIRRDLFDVLSPAARSASASAPVLTDTQRLDRSVATLGTIEMLPLACRLSPEFVVHLSAQRMSANRAPLMKLMEDARKGSLQTLPGKLEKLTPLSGPLYSLAQLRHEWNAAAANLYYDRPNLLTYRQQIRTAGDGSIRTSEGFDIVANAMAVHRTAKDDPVALRMRQGVTDANVEAALLRGVAPLGRPVKSASDVFTALPDNTTWTVLRSAQDLEAQKAQVSAGIRAHLARDVEAGYAVLIPATLPENGSSTAWWRVNLATGETLGMNDSGWGGALMEYTHLLIRISFTAYSAYKCINALEQSTTLDLEQKAYGQAACLVVGVLAVGALAAGSLTITVGGLVGTSATAAGAAAGYAASGGQF